MTNSEDPLQKVQAYRLAMALIPIARADTAGLRYTPGARELQAQLMRALGSIAANVAEGYSRTGAADRRKFYEYALGSAREAEVWYATTGLDPAKCAPALTHLVSIRRLLLVMIRNSAKNAASAKS